MKTMIVPAILIIVIGMVSCTQPGNSSQKQGEEHKAIVDKFIKATGSGDLATVEDLMADNYKDYGPTLNDSVNKEQNVIFFKNVAANTTGLKYDRMAAVAFHVDEGKMKGDWVSEWGTVSWVVNNTSKEVRVMWNGTYRVNSSGKIDLHYTYRDQADAFLQQGYKIIPPEEQKSSD